MGRWYVLAYDRLNLLDKRHVSDCYEWIKLYNYASCRRADDVLLEAMHATANVAETQLPCGAFNSSVS